MGFSRYDRRNAKFLVTLYGILEGIYCDISLNQDEVLFLDTWLLEQSELSGLSDQSYNIFSQAKLLTDTYLSYHNKSDSQFTDEFLTHLENLQEEILKYADDSIYNTYDDHQILINYLQGLCKGLIADGIIGNQEVICLSEWLSDHSNLENEPLINEFYNEIVSIDLNNISESDLEKTKFIILSFSDHGSLDSVAGSTVGDTFFDIVDSVNLQGKKVLFTGKFKLGSRAKCKALAMEQGAKVVEDVTKTLDYLIVGSFGSVDWTYSSYGKKIEMVKRWQSDYAISTKIITEDMWLSNN